MKIKMLQAMGRLMAGHIYDGAYTPVTNQAYIFDSSGSGWIVAAGQFEVAQQSEVEGVSLEALINTRGVEAVTITRVK